MEFDINALRVLFGLVGLILFFWYFATDDRRRKRVLGLVLTVVVAAFCLEEVYPPQNKVPLGIDLSGGARFELQLSPRTPDQEITPADVQQAITQIRKRIDATGGKEATIVPQQDNRIMVEVPGATQEDAEEYKRLLEQVARLEFKLVPTDSASRIAAYRAGEPLDPGYRIYPQVELTEEGEEEQVGEYLLPIRPNMTGEHVSNAGAYYGPEGWAIALNFDGKGAKQFGDITTENVGRQLAIVLDDVVQSAPNLNEPILGGSATISGRFTQEQANNLASVLENPLQVAPELLRSSTVSASLGADSIQSGIIAAISGLLATLICVALYYRVAGIVALTGILINIVVLFGAMSMFGFVLTLPGIAGIILTIGMAIDANVLIFERFKEERNAGKELRPAVDGAYSKALSAILDANVTTLITAFVLFWFASGPVKGFAVTLTIGILSSMFTALLVTRNIFEWLMAGKVIKKLSMTNILENTQINFLAKRHIAFAISGFLILLTIGVYAVRNTATLGPDFAGGDLIRIELPDDATTDQVRAALTEIGLEATIQREALGDVDLFSIRSEFETSDEITDQLRATFAEVDVISDEQIGPVVGQELLRSSGIALLLGLAVIMGYVALRFEVSFSVGAIAAVTHDVIVTLGLFALFGGQLSLMIVGAILTIAGYSINDTIVVFDRIRETIKNSPRKMRIIDLINTGLNQTLQRTLLTSATTLVTVLVLLIFGGPVLRDFALVLFIGMIIGTYSSIFVASPIVLWWTRMRRKDLRTEVKEEELERSEGTIGGTA